jgi:UDP-N-acetylmuramyl pentapeptide phosphotransferase/UDP-N-acetylglucosamine-1-phosphate transferase
MPASGGVGVFLAAVFLAVFAASTALTRFVLALLRDRAVLDRPNPRSSHSAPVPRGGGLAILATLLPAWGVASAMGFAPGAVWPAVLGALVLAALSFIDDLRGLPARLRLAVQLAVIAAVLPTLPHAGEVFQGFLPHALDLAASALIWLWFVNLNNFMDGIDGIAGTETVSIAGGVLLLALVDERAAALGAAPLAVALGASAGGFLVWNWQPARIFMGDVGSIPLGFLLGWLLLGLAGAGLWAAALILPIYYLGDATWTLLRRLARGTRIWEAHREHFYQRAVQSGLDHAAVVRRILLANLLLIGAAMLSRHAAWPALALAFVVVGALFVELARPHAATAGE